MSEQGMEPEGSAPEPPTSAPGAEPSSGEQPAAPAAAASRSQLLLPVVVAVVAVVLAAASIGALVGHKLWKTPSSTAAPAFVAPPTSGGNGGGGGGGSSSGGSIAAQVAPALVNVNSSFSYQGGAGAGTGIVVGSNGLVVTNNHVIDGATKITATDVGNGKTYDATVVGYDPSHDLAVLQLSGASGLTTAKLGDSSALSVGDSVVAIGNAGGAGGTPSSAEGSITALDQSITAGDELGGSSEQLSGLVQTDAGIQPGDSGGALVDSQGRVIGIITAGSSGFEAVYSGGEGFAIPINQAISTGKQIQSGHGSATVHIGPTAFLGVVVASPGSGFGGFGGFGDGSTTSSGVQIVRVAGGQPAQKAGLSAGAVITAIDGRSVDSPSTLSSIMLGHHPGDSVQLQWSDGSGTAHTTKVQLGSGPPA
jgi:S1-C subfamily serine protease